MHPLFRTNPTGRESQRFVPCFAAAISHHLDAVVKRAALWGLAWCLRATTPCGTGSSAGGGAVSGGGLPRPECWDKPPRVASPPVAADRGPLEHDPRSVCEYINSGIGTEIAVCCGIVSV